MDDLPEPLKGGEPARLFPVLAETSREGRALSVFLSCFAAVDDLARTLLATLGLRLGVRSRVQAFTEVVLDSVPDDAAGRPDGLIVVRTGRREWTALVEAKVRRAKLEADQMEGYLHLAKANGIDALVTISNDFAAVPNHHPVRISQRARRGVDLYHWSWTSILTHAKVLLADTESVADVEQRFLMNELVRFLDHPSTGVMRFDRMDGNWKGLVDSVIAGATLQANSDEVTHTVANWHQECRDLALKLMVHVSSSVSIKLPRAYRNDPQQRIADDAADLCRWWTLSVEYDIPDAASGMSVEVSLSARSIQVSMTVQAPQDRKSTRARTNWLLRQLRQSDADDLHLRARYARRSKAPEGRLAAVREDPGALQLPNGDAVPYAFEVRLVRDLGARFSGAKTFVDELERTVLRFYAEVGQRLRNWQPAPPKMADAQPGEEGNEA